jgi:inner membrane protein CreD
VLKRISAIALILIFTSIAWMVLAGSIWSRTNESNDKLRANVASIWGTPQEQRQPFATYEQAAAKAGDAPLATFLPAESSRVHVDLALEYRRKGLLWYSIYKVQFGGLYVFRNPTQAQQTVTFRLPFPAQQAVYDGLTMQLDGHVLPFTSDKDGAIVSAWLAPGQSASLRTGYRSQGMERWRYKLGDSVTQANDFELTMATNFKDIDFPISTLSPTEKRESASGWDLGWKYGNLISGFQIGMDMPEKLQPGPLAGDISRFAPVSLLLFFFVMFILTTLRKIDLHPMNYFFLAAAFFSFHLLLAYAVDHISIQLAFLVCSVVSVALVVSYLRLVVGRRFAVLEAGMAQLIYLVIFSYTFFLKGFTGLAITIGCILTLFVAMQMTGPIRWSDLFAGPSSTRPPIRANETPDGWRISE